MPLEVTMKYEHKRGRNIPYIVEACVEYLDTYAMETEGIFRLVLLTHENMQVYAMTEIGLSAVGL